MSESLPLTLAFLVVGFLLTGYAVLDGFDLGAGSLHLQIAKTDQERRGVLAAIGPFWDGNEVWLLATGGALFAFFPRALGSGLSSLYLGVFLLLWLLMGRGLSIELRSHAEAPLWRAFWDRMFMLTSSGASMVLGVALANVIRGLPLDIHGYASMPLFRSFDPRSSSGILDVFTISAGLFAWQFLTRHGALYLSWKGSEIIAARAKKSAQNRALPVLFAQLAIFGFAAWVREQNGISVSSVVANSFGILSVLAYAVSMLPGNSDRASFFASSGSLIFSLLGILLSQMPLIIPSTGAGPSLTVQNAQSATQGSVALGFFAVGVPIAMTYLVFLFRLHKGRIKAASGHDGY